VKPLTIYVGFDQREAVAYHVFCQSVLERSSVPVAFVPLAANAVGRMMRRELPHDGSNAFTYSRFLVPHLQDHEGWAVFADGDMVCNNDIAELAALADDRYAVMVVPHEYRTKHPVKYLGSPNPDYPRKNWSSLVLWNCSHPSNAWLTPAEVARRPGSFLHRFQWLDADEIGTLPATWNHLVLEQERDDDAAILHFTVGSPCFREYANCESAEPWHRAYRRAIHCEQGLAPC
jgi:hypothetical protein